MRPFYRLALIGILLLGLAGTAMAGVVYVKAGATGSQNGLSWTNAYVDLQAALATAQSGDEIWVAAGTYKPTTGTLRTKSFVMPAGVALYGGFAGGETARNQRDWAANMTLLSGDIGAQGNATDNSYHVVVGANNTVLDGFTVSGGTNIGSVSHGAGMINDGVSPAIANCTFSRNTTDSDGAGMYNANNASPTVTNCTFTSNTTTHGLGGGMANTNYAAPKVTKCGFISNSANGGGAMYNTSSASPVMTSCTFSGNTAGYRDGGGMFNTGSALPTVNNCTFNGNTASFGGGMYNDYGLRTVTNGCSFKGNIANGGRGGGMYNRGFPMVTNCSFSGNRVRDYGGGMHIDNDAPTITNCTFNDNTSGAGGGMAIYSINGNAPTVTNCMFSGNSAYRGGGIYSNTTGSTKVTNCTIYGNSADLCGGGMYSDNGTPAVTNCILWGDAAPSGSEVYTEYSSNPTFSHCDIHGSGSSGDLWDLMLGTDGGGNIAADPQFVNAAKPAGTDGVWLTKDDGLALRSGSPCINTGDPAGAPANDILGNSRGATPDIGAYEYQVPKNGVAMWTCYP